MGDKTKFIHFSLGRLRMALYLRAVYITLDKILGAFMMMLMA